MCFDTQARAPRPPRTGHLASSDRLTLEADDGATPAATLASTAAPDPPGVVILPDIRGLHTYYEDLAAQVAQAGAHAVALDLYSRTAGPGHRDDAFEWEPHRAAARDAQVRADVRAANLALRGAGAVRVFVVGFCFGGRAAFMQASQPDVDGVAGLYGWPTRGEEGGRSPVDEAREGLVRAPVLAIYGGADEKITQDDIRAYDEALEAADVPHETVVYPGAPHSFFDRSMAEHAEACADVWRRLLRLIGVEG